MIIVFDRDENTPVFDGILAFFVWLLTSPNLAMITLVLIILLKKLFTSEGRIFFYD